MYEPPIRPQPMTDVERRLFVRKAKADRLAFDCAQLLSKGETSKAATAKALIMKRSVNMMVVSVR